MAAKVAIKKLRESNELQEALVETTKKETVTGQTTELPASFPNND